MKTTPIAKLKKQYEEVCHEYIKKFCKKQGFEFDRWIGKDIGGISVFGDYCFTLADIIWDINSNQPKGLILQWQNDCIESPTKSINYYSYSKGLRFKDL